MLSTQSSNTKVFVEDQTDDLGGARWQLVDGERGKHMRLRTLWNTTIDSLSI